MLGLVISKESKVSEFRQAWIDSLREEIAAIVTHATGVRAQLAGEHFVPLNEAWAKVRLRLNPMEELHVALLDALGAHEALFANGNRPTQVALDASDLRLLHCTQTVLKSEWERVKRGESTFLRAKEVAETLLVVGLLLFAGSLVVWAFSTFGGTQYRVVARTDSYVGAQGQAVSDLSYDHEVVDLVLTHDGRKIYGRCDLSTLNKLDPSASCGLRPLRYYDCVVDRDDVMRAPLPFSDLTCRDGDGRKVYLYVSKEE